MSSDAAFVAACAPDHPEVQVILAFLDRTLPPAAGDPLSLLRRVQAAVMLLLAGRLESRLLAALDNDQQALPSAALIRQAARARTEAMNLLETLIADQTAAPPPNPEMQPADGTCSGQESLPNPPSSEAGNREISKSDPPASVPSAAAGPTDAAQGSDRTTLPARNPQNGSALTVPDLNTGARGPAGRPGPGTGLVVPAPRLTVPPRDQVKQPPQPSRKTGPHNPAKP